MEPGATSIYGYLYNSGTFNSAEAYLTSHHYLPKSSHSLKKERNKVIHISFDKMNDIKDHESSLSRVVRICNTIKRLKKEARDERTQNQQLRRPRQAPVIPAKCLQKKEVQNVTVDQQETAVNLYRWWAPINTAAECIQDDIGFEEIHKQQYHYPRWYDNESILSVQVEDFVNFEELQVTSCVSDTQYIDSKNLIIDDDFSINIVEELSVLIADTNY